MFLSVRESLSNKTLSQTLFKPCRQKSGTNVRINAAEGCFQFLALVNMLSGLRLTCWSMFRQLITQRAPSSFTEINQWNKSRVISVGETDGLLLSSRTVRQINDVYPSILPSFWSSPDLVCVIDSQKETYVNPPAPKTQTLCNRGVYSGQRCTHHRMRLTGRSWKAGSGDENYKIKRGNNWNKNLKPCQTCQVCERIQ